MARLYTVGYEVHVPSGTGTMPDNPSAVAPSGTVTRDTSNQRTGNGCLACDSGAGNAAAYQSIAPNPSAGLTYYLRGYLKFGALPSADTRVMGYLSTNGISVRLTTGGKLQLWKNNTTEAQIGSDSSATLTTGVYYRIELSYLISAIGGNIEACELLLDGTSVASTSGVTYTGATNPIRIGWLTAPGASKLCYIDDVAYNNDTGAGQSDYPGPGKVVMLIPTSDSAVGTGWTTSGASSSNLFNCTNNEPPTGIADTTSNEGHQVRNATNNANVDFDANMTTYTDAGIAAADTINVIIGWAVVGAPSGTSPKTGAISVVSNPAISSAWSGTFYAGVVAGTFPTGWGGQKTVVSEAPSVTLGTAPVMRLRQVTGSTRIAMSCFLGMYVDYTPGLVNSDVLSDRRTRRRVLNRRS